MLRFTNYAEAVEAKAKIDAWLAGAPLFAAPAAPGSVDPVAAGSAAPGFDFRSCVKCSKSDALAIIRRCHPVHTRTVMLAIAESDDGIISLDDLKTRWGWGQHIVAGITRSTRTVTGDRKANFFACKPEGSRRTGDQNWLYAVPPETHCALKQIVSEHPELFEQTLTAANQVTEKITS